MTGPVGDDAVGRAFAAVDRRLFLPWAQRGHAAEDRPLPIGHGQTCSQPSTVAAMLRLLDVPPGTSVLDVGAGSGWTTVLLARLTGPAGTVLGVERVPELAAWGAANVARAAVPWARLLPAARGVLGAPRDDGWPRVLVSASPDVLPPALVDQVAPGGRMVIPVAGTMLVVDRAADGSVQLTEHGTYRFVPLVED
ncbi:protein-L-isoaspartate(D-aspartate) O-methyltransferase [Isoptericola jiangsuensis]|uniref:Protein-L-isoaspartate O-methyltransferase n=1 Tax=Isoptericola jiangsuensis TaxID=548579 RepID=A0A2A9EYR4_9MICO|nr:protein-L-isoaspartate carboxylmethyltransferase [Isoptericola jiangsuensis]PFG43706.1 protein-L-isoaspartate(D-aspartate) O-methyltransferase [Isoptericola jiangsuensis]